MDSMLLPVVMFGGLGLMMFFGMRKQKRQAAEAQKMQESIVPGARVMTSSGLHGTVVVIADDTVELEVAPGVATTWARAAIREVVVPVLDDEDELVVENEYASDIDVDGDEPRQSDIG